MTGKAKLSFLKKWLWRKITSAYDWLLYALHVYPSAEISEEVIVFACDNTRLEIGKYAYCLHQKYQTKIVLMMPKTRVGNFLKGNEFHKVFIFRNSWHLLRILKSAERYIELIHYFGRASTSGYKILTKTDFPFIFSGKDLSVMYEGLDTQKNVFKNDLKFEKYCLAHANGVISESLEIQPARRIYQIPKVPSLFFPIYTDNRFFITPEKKSLKEIHWVYIGGVHPKSASPELGTMKLHWLIDACEKNRIFFHIYPNHGLHPSIYREYFSLAEKNQYFTMHKPVEPEKISQEISRYHFGIIPFFDEDTTRLPLKRRYCTSNKLFNYIEAGLPVLISEDMQFQLFLARKMRAGISMKKNDFINFQEKRKAIDYEKTVNELLKQRETYCLENQIGRMYYFYNKIKK
ncbi:MAG: hypothetical protein D6707_02735 [Bacteroidetes bacterium]|nr:MAG: hypothetical protein D6707_02735 [Bacteroidota bacterium]